MKKNIVIHDDNFNANDVMTCAIASIHTIRTYGNYQIIRTNNTQEFENALYVINVGNKYDGIKYFDDSTKSSAKTMWNLLGKEIINKMFYNISDSIINDIYIQIDNEIMNTINAANMYNYLTFSYFINQLNPVPNVELPKNKTFKNIQDEAFKYALNICQEFLIKTIKHKLFVKINNAI